MFCLVHNIPKWMHSADLRRFFSLHIEEGRFQMFHYKRRVDSFTINECLHKDLYHCQCSLQSQLDSVSTVDSNGAISNVAEKFCCFVQLSNDDSGDLMLFVRRYNRELWPSRADEVNDADEEKKDCSKCCLITPLKLVESSLLESLILTSNYKGSTEIRRRHHVKISWNKLTKDFILKLPEFQPPSVYPNGNVGTPTTYFLEQINACKLPALCIRKLGLDFSLLSKSNRSYVRVPYCYDESNVKKHHSTLKRKYMVSRKPTEHSAKSDNEDSSGEEEEWERHAAIYGEDPYDQKRNEELVYEPELELVWEKGGPGIVWHTDTKFWNELEGDFDEQTTDDWDVDFHEYYGTGGDMDARDASLMRASDADEMGILNRSAFNAKTNTCTVNRKHRRGSQHDKVSLRANASGWPAEFLKQHGWRTGCGLGSRLQGRPNAIEQEGQLPTNKAGIGYRQLPSTRMAVPHAERWQVQRHTTVDDDYHVIGTVFDRPSSTNVKAPTVQSQHISKPISGSFGYLCSKRFCYGGTLRPPYKDDIKYL